MIVAQLLPLSSLFFLWGLSGPTHLFLASAAIISTLITSFLDDEAVMCPLFEKEEFLDIPYQELDYRKDHAHHTSRLRDRIEYSVDLSDGGLNLGVEIEVDEDILKQGQGGLRHFVF